MIFFCKMYGSGVAEHLLQPPKNRLAKRNGPWTCHYWVAFGSRDSHLFTLQSIDVTCTYSGSATPLVLLKCGTHISAGDSVL